MKHILFPPLASHSARFAREWDANDFVYTEETIGDLTWGTATAVDKEGTACPDAEVEVTFDGDVLATCSGNMKDCVPAPS